MEVLTGRRVARPSPGNRTGPSGFGAEPDPDGEQVWFREDGFPSPRPAPPKAALERPTPTARRLARGLPHPRNNRRAYSEALRRIDGLEDATLAELHGQKEGAS